MSFFNKVKEQASAAADKAKEAGKAGQAKLDAMQAKRKADGLLHDLGAAIYADRTGRGNDQTKKDADRIVQELKDYEAEYGPLAS